MKTTRSKIIVLAVVATIAAFAALPSMMARNWDDEAAKRKAQYIFLESQDAYNQDDIDKFLMLTMRAYALDSTDYDIAAQWASVVMATNNDSALWAKGYNYLKQRFFSDTTDYLTGMALGNLARRRLEIADAEAVWKTLNNAYPELSQPSHQLADVYLVGSILGDSTAFDKAMAIYQRMENGTGKNVQLSSLKIRAYSTKNDTAAIIHEVEDLVNYAPQDYYVALFAGENYNYLGDTVKALKYYDLACQLDPSNGDAFMAKAHMYDQIGDSLAYDQAVFNALKSENIEVESKLEILRDYVSKLYTDPSQESRIRELFGELESMHSGEAEIHNLYVAYLYQINDYKGAAEEMSYAVALQPAIDDAWSFWVQLLDLAGEEDAVVEKSREAMARFPDNLFFPIVIAQSYQKLGEVDRALELMDSVKIVNIANAKAVSNFKSYYGDLNALKGDTIGALSAYDEAIALDPDNFLALNNAAYYMAENDMDLDKADKYISRVMRSVTDNPTYLDTYAWVCFKKGDYSLAKQYIDMTLDMFKTGIDGDEGSDNDNGSDKDNDSDAEENHPSAELYDHAGDIYFFNQLFDQAREYWKKAHELDPDNELIAKKAKSGTYFKR